MVQTIQNLLADARVLLDASGATEARLGAEILLGHATGRERAFFHAHPEADPGGEGIARFNALLTRHCAGEPLAYIIGEREFWSLPLKLNRHTLIPRPETELLVEQALARIPAGAAWTLADLGTGSGAVALALATERPRCRVIATDICERALAMARANAGRLGLDNVDFRHGSWLDALDGTICDIIVSNPPYVAAGDPHLRQPEIGFEPRAALVAGPAGLDAIDAIVAAAPAHLVPGGALLLEHGFDQREPVAAGLAAAGCRDIHCYRDLAGHDRVSTARRDAGGNDGTGQNAEKAAPRFFQPRQA